MCHNVLRFSFIMSDNVPLSMQCVFAANCIAVAHTGISFRAALIFVSGIYRVLLLLSYSLSLLPAFPHVDRGCFVSWRFNRRFCERATFFVAIFLFLGERKRERETARNEALLNYFRSQRVVHLAPSESVMYLERNLRLGAATGRKK